MDQASNLFNLDGEPAVVTGAFGKLGPIWCASLLQAGARVLCLDLPGVEPDEQAAELFERYGNNISRAEADVCDRGSLEKALACCVERFGTPAILVNNAGIDQPPGKVDGSGLLWDISIETNRDIMGVNALGLFQASQVFGKAMAEAGKGSIINIGSLYAAVSPDSHFYDHINCDPPFLKPPAYGASKAAVVNFTRYLATLLAPQGVRVNALSPGGVLGGQDEEFKAKFNARVPMGRMAVPEDLAGPLLFLATEASAYVTGIELPVDGGFRCW